MNVPSHAWRISLRVRRWIGRSQGTRFGLIAVLALAGASYEAIAAVGDARRYPVPDQLVDVGGYQMHIHCVDAGSPAVVLDAGLGGSSLDWSLVQSELGSITLGSDSRLIIAEGNGHYIQWDQPTLVIDAVREVIAKARCR